MNNKTKRIAFLGVMIALSGVLSLIKIPIASVGTLAFDAVPGFLVAILINPILGGIVALAGHLFSATISGYPLSIIGHLIVSVSMFASAYALGKIFIKKYSYTLVIASVVAIALNVYLSMPFLNLISNFPWNFLLTLQIPLFIASTANVVLAILVYFSLRKVEL